MSPLAELIVGRVLQDLGADPLIYEDEAATGGRLDWHAAFSGRWVWVEVASPIINPSVGRDQSDNDVLEEEVERRIPPGWRVHVLKLPDLGPNDSKSEFRRALASAMAALPADPAEAGRIELREELRGGTLRLMFTPGRDPQRPAVHMSASIAYIDDSERRIRDTVERKRRQVRGADEPVILAIRGSGYTLGARPECFDFALFGHTVAGLDGERFEADGLFSRGGDEAPTYAAVLAMPLAGHDGAYEPVIYVHPRYDGTLPEELLSLERRYLTDDGIRVVPATVTGLLQEFADFG
jgi:hypothetical protein